MPSVTHPSEPNYIASVSGDFYGLADDDFYCAFSSVWSSRLAASFLTDRPIRADIPSNVSTIVDLLEAKNVSWATYQEVRPLHREPQHLDPH